MKSTLFVDTEGLWYRDRLQHMYKTRPKCPLLYAMNHLVGTCPTCGLGNYAKSKRWNVRYMTIDRIYPILCSPKDDSVHRLAFAISQCQRLATNTEFPIPMVRYQTFVHIPPYIDVESNRVLDFLPNTRRGKLLAKATSLVLSKVGYDYSVYVGKKEVFRNNDITLSARKALNAGLALQRIVARLQND